VPTVKRNGIARSAALIAVLPILHVMGASMAAAQSPATAEALIEGTVRDSTGQPVQRTQVCTIIWKSRAVGRALCGSTDSTGAYRVDSLPASRLGLAVTCQGVRQFGGRLLASDSIDFPTGARVRRDWIVSRRGCDPRPIRRVTGIFRGHYTPGFESSAFVPCESDGWFLPADSLEAYSLDSRRAWATFQPGVSQQRLEWPDVEHDRYGNPRYYVRWRGTVVGPGHYGHLGVSPFEIRVDSLLDLRAPNKHDCH